ncbi:MAG: hypothetical protein CMP66_01760 [Flavobacteriales bacterium]|nr:hypothetical protein [Flavobacteriales bacterium]|tara:strand:+ start:16101 stop:16943 length:843 start_codon:yes stop_codon:yes gene_type:complete
MKKILIVLAIAFSATAYAQHEKGEWMLGVSSSNLGFNSNSGSSSITNVEYAGWRTDTLQLETTLYTMGDVFPYTHNIQEDKNSQMNLNIHIGHFLADQFAMGIKGGFNNETSLLKSSPLSSDLLNLSPDSVGNNLGEYPFNLNLYNLIASTASNDFTANSMSWSIAPFARYYHRAGKGSLFIDASFEYGEGKSEVKANNITIDKASLTHQQINAGIGYSIALGGIINMEPMIAYQSISSTMVSTQDVPNPYNPIDLGTETTTFDRKSANIHFSIGITAFL